MINITWNAFKNNGINTITITNFKFGSSNPDNINEEIACKIIADANYSPNKIDLDIKTTISQMKSYKNQILIYIFIIGLSKDPTFSS